MSQDYFESLIVWSLDGPAVRKMTFDEARAIHPAKNALTLDRDIRRAWSRLVGPSEKVERPGEMALPPLVSGDPTYVNSVKLKKDRATRFVAIYDAHWPYNIAQPQLEAFLRDFKPDHLIYGGDAINNDAFSHWAMKVPREARSLPTPQTQFREANRQFFGPLREAAGNATITYILGNHEDWTNRAIDDEPRGEGFWEIERNIQGIDQWVRNRETLRVGKLYVIHGDVVQNSGVTPARGLILKGFHKNVLAGHLHTYNVATITTPYDDMDRHVVEYAPCMCSFDPPFMSHRSHAWLNGFVYGIVEPDGTFHKHTVIITEGKFYANGKFYAP